MKFAYTFLCAIVLYSCGGGKKKNECLEYFESKKEQIIAHDSAISRMADTLTDLPEDDNAVLFMNLMMEGDAQKGKDVPGPHGNGFQPDPWRTFMVSVETLKEKPLAREIREQDIDVPSYHHSFGAKVLRMGEDVRSGDLHCYTDTVNVLKRAIDHYLGIKYIAVTDCIFYKPAKINGERSYTGGILAKQVRIYDIATGKEVNRLYVTARSSDKMDMSYNANNIRLNNDLLKNFSAKLKAALFNNDIPKELYLFNF